MAPPFCLAHAHEDSVALKCSYWFAVEEPDPAACYSPTLKRWCSALHFLPFNSGLNYGGTRRWEILLIHEGISMSRREIYR